MQISISCVYVSINFLFNLFSLVVAMFKCYVFSVGQKLTGLCWFVEPHPTKKKKPLWLSLQWGLYRKLFYPGHSLFALASNGPGGSITSNVIEKPLLPAAFCCKVSRQISFQAYFGQDVKVVCEEAMFRHPPKCLDCSMFI